LILTNHARLGWSLSGDQPNLFGLVGVPVGSTNFGLTLGSTASANINQRESTTGTPAKTDGGTGFRQCNLDDQSGFANTYLIDKLTFGSEQIAAGISTSTDQFWADRDTSFASNRHAVQPELNPSLPSEIQHETITKVVGQESFESEVSDHGTFINGGSIVGIPNLDFSLQPTTPGGNGSVSNLEAFDLQELSLFSLQPGANLIQVPGGGSGSPHS
jgi:hypothetical protein